MLEGSDEPGRGIALHHAGVRLLKVGLLGDDVVQEDDILGDEGKDGYEGNEQHGEHVYELPSLGARSYPTDLVQPLQAHGNGAGHVLHGEGEPLAPLQDFTSLTLLHVSLLDLSLLSLRLLSILILLVHD